MPISVGTAMILRLRFKTTRAGNSVASDHGKIGTSPLASHKGPPLSGVNANVSVHVVYASTETTKDLNLSVVHVVLPVSVAAVNICLSSH
jgi:hypothetical protein